MNAVAALCQVCCTKENEEPSLNKLAYSVE